MIKYKYDILNNVNVEPGVILNYMRGYIKVHNRIFSFSVMDDMVYLHNGDVNDLQTLCESMNLIDSGNYSTNDLKAFSNAEKAFLYMESKEIYKVWTLE